MAQISYDRLRNVALPNSIVPAASSVKALPSDGPLRTTPLAEFDIARVVAKPGAALEECFLLEWQPSREPTGLFGVCLVSISKRQERESAGTKRTNRKAIGLSIHAGPGLFR